MKKLSKEGVMEYYDLDESEYKDLEKLGLVPDHSEESEKKYKELMRKGPSFTENEIWFLGAMYIADFQMHHPAEAEEYMDL